MTDPTLSSTNPSQNAEAEPSSENLPTQSQKDSWLSEIPLFNQSESEPTKSKDSTPSDSFSMEPVSCESPNPNEPTKYEYEFSHLYNGALHFVYLYDTNDVSACERVLHRPVKPDEITYSESTGNGFVENPPFKFTFIKEPYQKTWTTHADIKAGVDQENMVAKRQSKPKMNAEDILSSL